MRLTAEDTALFYKLYPALHVYANQRAHVLDGVATVDDLMARPIADRLKLRQAAQKQEGLIDAFVAENPFHLSPAEIEIVGSWKHQVAGTFYILRCLKSYTIFLDAKTPPRAYGVLALRDSFEDMLGPRLPVMAEPILLPFKGQIIYDGLLPYKDIFFGPGIRRSLNASYQEAKAKFGIITSLPYRPAGPEESDLDRLKFYMRTQASREEYVDEIVALVRKSPDLMTFYHQEMGRVHARAHKKRLREIGVRDGWFALLEGNLIASGTDRKQLEALVDRLVPPEKRGFAYLFRLKGD